MIKYGKKVPYFVFVKILKFEAQIRSIISLRKEMKIRLCKNARNMDN